MPKIGQNIYKRKDGRWEGRYKKGRDAIGKLIYGFIYGKTRAEVKKRLSSIEEQNALTVASSKSNLAFACVSEQWLSSISQKVKASTYAGYLNALNLHILPLLGERDMLTLSAADINGFTNDKLRKGRADGNGGLSPKTVRDILSVIRAIISYAHSEKIISGTFQIIYPKHQKQAVRVLSRQEQSTLENVLTADMDIHRLGILLCLYTGIRVGELCALHWSDISPEFDILSIRSTLQRVKNVGGDNKKTKIMVDTPNTSHSVRQIPIPKFIIPYLIKFAGSGHSYFLETDYHSFTEPRTMQNHFAKLAKAANINDANFHSLRHTFANRCLEAGVDIKSLSEMLGHANINITLNQYAHSSIEQKRAGMDKLENYIGC